MQLITLSNRVELELVQEDGLFQGLGRVTCGQAQLRSGARPMFVDIRSPDGVELLDYRLQSQTADGDSTVLEFTASRRDGGLMEWMVHEVRNRIPTGDWTRKTLPAPGTSLRLILKPVTRGVNGRTWTGFSYQYQFSSPDIRIYKMLDRATWEPGGHAVGTSFWMRNCFTPSTVQIESTAQFHSTEWYLPDCSNPNIFQFLPLQTELQGFTFTSSRQGVLVTWTPQVRHVRSLFEKPRGADLWVHLHEHCADLGNRLETAEMEVLWLPADEAGAGAQAPAPGRTGAGRGFNRVDLMNLYEDVRELVHDALHRAAGIRREPNPTYGMIEEWETADLKRYIELGLPKLLEAGVEVIGIANHFSHNMNTFGVSNMCCTVDHRIAQSVGEENVKRFCDIAKSQGVSVEMWGNTALSTIALAVHKRNGAKQLIDFYPDEGTAVEVLSKCEDPYVRNASNAIESDHYAPQFAAMNLRDAGVRRHWLGAWQHAHNKVGLERIFLDSSFNMSSDKFHWIAHTQPASRAGATADQVHLLGRYRPAAQPQDAIKSQYLAHLEIVARMQDMGIHYCTEDLGVFGVHRHGPGADARLDNLFMWSECLIGFDVPAILKRAAAAGPVAQVDLDDVFFRGLAYRMVWMIHWDPKRDCLSFNYSGANVPEHVPAPRHLEMLRRYKSVRSRMVERHILAGEAGVAYRNGPLAVVWAFSDFALGVDRPATVGDAAQDGVQDQAVDPSEQPFEVRKRGIYLLDFDDASAGVPLSDLIRLVPRESAIQSPAASMSR